MAENVPVLSGRLVFCSFFSAEMTKMEIFIRIEKIFHVITTILVLFVIGKLKVGGRNKYFRRIF